MLQPCVVNVPTIQNTSRLSEFMELNDKALKMQLAYIVNRSGTSLKHVVQAYIDNNINSLIDVKEYQILQSYTLHKYTSKKHMQSLDELMHI
jgi:hypothetical protein